MRGMPPSAWEQLDRRIVACAACPRLRTHCETVAREKRAAYRDDDYWGRPVPNFGVSTARNEIAPEIDLGS